MSGLRTASPISRMADHHDDWLIGAIDQGTTSSRMFVFDSRGSVVCSSQKPVGLLGPCDGWAEHDPMDVLRAVDGCMDECGRALAERSMLHKVKCIGVAVHRESTIAFDRSSWRPLSNIVLWLDTRTCDLVSRYRHCSDLLARKTGLKPSTYFSAFKMRWLADKLQDSSTASIGFSTVDAWLLHHLTGVYKTDMTNASRTMLLNLQSKEYDPELLEMFGISRSQLASIHPSIHNYGMIKKGPFKDVPITAVFGDQQASLLGQGCTNKGDIKCTLGTGAFMLINTGPDHLLVDEFITTVVSSEHYALEAPIALASNALTWLKDRLGFSVPSGAPSNGVLFVPALAGLLAPFWRPDLKGSFHNLTLNTCPAHMAAAVADSIVFSIGLCVERLRERLGWSMDVMRVDGGLSNDGRLLQMIADVCDMRIATGDVLKECTALGAAMGAANYFGLDIDTSGHGFKVIEPSSGRAREELKRTYVKWKVLMRELAGPVRQT